MIRLTASVALFVVLALLFVLFMADTIAIDPAYGWGYLALGAAASAAGAWFALRRRPLVATLALYAALNMVYVLEPIEMSHLFGVEDERGIISQSTIRPYMAICAVAPCFGEPPEWEKAEGDAWRIR